MEEVAQQSPEAVRLPGPFLRWAGGKRALAPTLVPEILASSPRLYIEPFLGGGAIALSLPRELPKVLSDVHPHLIDAWLCMRNLSGELYKELDDVCATYGNGPAGYIRARDEFNKMTGNARTMWARRAAFMLYLNARCFNGLWRTNGAGHFNVPFGKLDKPRTYHWDEIQALSAHLHHATIFSHHYAKVLGDQLHAGLNAPLRRGDIKAAKTALAGVAIYCDPPYDETFHNYAKHGFDVNEQMTLASTLSSCAMAGAAVWTSNSDTPRIRELYSGWAQIEVIEERHSVGAKAERRGKRPCVLIRAGGAVR